jgi:TrkA domain protein
VDVERTLRPGIGLWHVFDTERGRRVGVVSHRNGRRDLVVYHRDDPDSAADAVVLSVAEANGLAELAGLGTDRGTAD